MKFCRSFLGLPKSFDLLNYIDILIPGLESLSSEGNCIVEIKQFLNHAIPLPDFTKIPRILRYPTANITSKRASVPMGIAKINLEFVLQNVLNPETCFRFAIGNKSWGACDFEFISPLTCKVSSTITFNVPFLTGIHLS